MKTSNKILSGLFIFPFLVVLFINLALYAKIKRGDYITVKQYATENSITKHTSSFSDIDLSSFKNGFVSIQYSDSFSVQYDKQEKDNIEFLQEGNKIILKAKPGKSYNTASIFCPSFNNLSFGLLDVEVDTMYLSNTTINLGPDANLRFRAQINNLHINADDRSRINIESNAVVDTLHMKLANGANFNKDNDGLIKQIGEIQLEDSALIYVDGKTMRMFLEKKNAPAKP